METRRVDDARRALDAMATKGFATITKDVGYLNALAHLSLVAVGSNRATTPRRSTCSSRRTRTYNTPNAFGYYLGSVSYFLGILARFLGRSATQATSRGRARDERPHGCVPEVARTQLALADVLPAGDARVAHARANDLVARQRRPRAASEMAPLLAQIEAFRDQQASPAARLKVR